MSSHPHHASGSSARKTLVVFPSPPHPAAARSIWGLPQGYVSIARCPAVVSVAGGAFDSNAVRAEQASDGGAVGQACRKDVNEPGCRRRTARPACGLPGDV